MEIFARILASIAGEQRALTKTHIMYRANLSFRQLQNYLPLLLELDLIKEVKEENRVTYEIAEKGKLFLKAHRALKELTTIKEERAQLLRG